MRGRDVSDVFVPAKPSMDMFPRLSEEWMEYVERFYGFFEKPLEAFWGDVLAGKVLDGNGLKLSPSQVGRQPPFGGFLYEVLGGSEAYRMARASGRLGYRAGTVVKINGGFDPELSQHHNRWAVVTRVVDAYHYEVVLESFVYERLVIRDWDVKGIVGDALHDYAGIGLERHRREVIPLIEKALAGKIPMTTPPLTWPRPPVRQACVIASLEGGLSKAIRRVRSRLAEVEKCYRHGLYFSELDYRYAKGVQMLWLRLFEMVRQKRRRLRKMDGVRRYMVLESRLGMFRRLLEWSGIPYLVRRRKGFYEVYTCREDDVLANPV